MEPFDYSEFDVIAIDQICFFGLSVYWNTTSSLLSNMFLQRVIPNN